MLTRLCAGDDISRRWRSFFGWFHVVFALAVLRENCCVVGGVRHLQRLGASLREGCGAVRVLRLSGCGATALGRRGREAGLVVGEECCAIKTLWGLYSV